MSTYRVSATIKTPVLMPDELIHLDALLAYAAVQMHGGDFNKQHDIPVERTDGSNWVFKASALKFSAPIDVYDQVWTRKLTEAEYINVRSVIKERADGGISSIDHGSGDLKSYYSAHNCVVVSNAHGYLVTDNPDIVLSMLNDHVKSIGKWAKNGFGEVSQWMIEDADICDAWKWRAMPAAFDENHDNMLRKDFGNIRAPYWKKQTYQDVLLPKDSWFL